MYWSLSGGSLLLHPSPLPLRENVVFPLCLDVAVGQVGGHKRKYAAMMMPLSRAIVKSVDALPPSRRPVPLFGRVVGDLDLNFRGMAPMGRISARREKRQFEVQRRSRVSKNTYLRMLRKKLLDSLT